MSSPHELFVVFLVVGLVLLALEVIAPGGILGAFAGLSILAAVVTGFVAFGPQGGFLAAFAVVVVGGLILALWIKVFPNTPMGRVLTLRHDERAVKSAGPDPASLIGKSGTAQTRLRPGGIAVIDGQRTDVVSESGYIESGAAVSVVRVEGSRVIVRGTAS